MASLLSQSPTLLQGMYHSYLLQGIIQQYPGDFKSANSTEFEPTDQNKNHSLYNASQHVTAIISAERFLVEHYNSGRYDVKVERKNYN